VAGEGGMMPTGISLYREFIKHGHYPNGLKWSPHKTKKTKRLTIVSCKVRDKENLIYEKKLKRISDNEKKKEKETCVRVCNIIKEYHGDLSEDPNRLPTKFIRDLILGDTCVR
jgi:hypothetical protein